LLELIEHKEIPGVAAQNFRLTKRTGSSAKPLPYTKQARSRQTPDEMSASSFPPTSIAFVVFDSAEDQKALNMK
jgi:hypothetical protein